MGLAFLALATLGHAATSTWTATSGNWEDSGNWDGGVPVASSTAILNNGGAITVTNGTAALLRVGTSSGGSGSVLISSGLLSVKNMYLGNAAGSSGSAVITGGTCLSTDNDITIGNSGTGVLTVAGPGTVTSHSDGKGQLLVATNSTANATVNIGTGGSAGTVNAEAITGGDGTAMVNFNHTDLYTFGAKMTGSKLSVTKLSSGTTVLTAASTYRGLTQVSAGELDVNGSLYTSGTVRVEAGATLGGSGSVGNVFAYSGTVAPTAGQALSLTTMTLDETSTLASAITSSTSVGQVKASSSVSLSGTLALTGLSFLTPSLPVTLIDETGVGLISGTFGAVTVSGTQVVLTPVGGDAYTFVVDSLLYELDYSGGPDSNDVTLALVPEPSQAMLLMGGVCLLGFLRCFSRPRCT